VRGDQLSQRVGTTEREQVLGLLGKALEEGYLGLDEYEQRVAVVTAAKTVYDLTRQVADLPPRLRWTPHSRPAPVGGVDPSEPARITAITSLVLGLVSLPMAFCIGIGGIIGVTAAALSVPGLRSGSPRERGKATVGLVTGLLSVALSAVVLMVLILG